jgi:restriction system protein
MKWKMHDNSLFAVLLRSPWWASLLLAIGVVAAMRLMVPTMYAMAGGIPFTVIAVIAAWRQLRVPSPAKVAAQLDALRALSWDEFAPLVEAGFRREGYGVTRITGAADFEISKGGRLSLVCAKRWKASVSGVEPLKELAAEGKKREAWECVYVCAGELSDKARAFALENRIMRVEGVELINLAPPP